MRLLVEQGGGRIYDDGDDWVLTGGGFTDRVKKTTKPMYPVAAVTKWGATPVDIPYLEALAAGGLAGVKKFLAKEKI
jgi:hypothetical protein